jgi:hypothetical protein
VCAPESCGAVRLPFLCSPQAARQQPIACNHHIPYTILSAPPAGLYEERSSAIWVRDFGIAILSERSYKFGIS